MSCEPDIAVPIQDDPALLIRCSVHGEVALLPLGHQTTQDAMDSVDHIWASHLVGSTFLCESADEVPDLVAPDWTCPCCRHATLANVEGRWCGDCDISWEADGTDGGRNG